MVFVVLVISSPSRSTTITAWRSPLSRISCWTCSQPSASTPLNETIRSPASSPTLRAGVGCSRISRSVQTRPDCSAGTTHACTSSIVVAMTRSAPLPQVANTAAKMPNAMSEVDRRAAGHDDDLLPRRHLVEEPVGVVGAHQLPLGGAGVGDQLREHAGVGLPDPGDLTALRVVGHLLGEVLGTRRQHPDDLDVPAERDRLDAVLGLADLLAPHRGAEADEVLGDLPAELLRRDHVAELVEPDRDQDGDHEDEHPEGVEKGGGHRWCGVLIDRMVRAAASRAHASAARTSSSVSCSPEGTS